MPADSCVVPHQCFCLLHPAGSKGPLGASQSVSRPQHYTSHRIPLKSPVPKLSNQQAWPTGHVHWHSSTSRPPENEQARLPMGAASTTKTYRESATLSQLLQHPLRGTAEHEQQQQHVLDRSLRQQVLQQYQGQYGSTVRHGPGTALPVLRQSESPLPPLSTNESPNKPTGSPPHMAAASRPAATQQQQQQQKLRSLSPSELAGWPHQHWSGSSPPPSAAAAGLEALSASYDSLRGSHSSSLFSQRYHKPLQQHQQQLGIARQPMYGMSAAASRVLESSVPSFYDGSGPLTAGQKPAWSSSRGQLGSRSVQAGADLAQVGCIH